MPRHDPGSPPSAEAVRAGRRLSAAVRPEAGLGLLDGPPLLPRAVEQPWPGPDHSPPHSRIRWRTGGRAAALLCLLATAFLVWFWWQASSSSAEVSPLTSVHLAEADEEPAPEPETAQRPAVGSSNENGGEVGGTTIVHVAGAVVRAGIVELPRGSRLHQAIAAAGGSAADADPGQLNLAAVVEDGQKIVVPRQGETVPPGTPSAAGSGTPGGAPGGDASPPGAGMINLNTARVEELATLPRVGPVLAQRIVEWRTQHGHFQRVEELDAVDGVGPKLLAALLPLVRV